jgi:hypothetical protein
MRVTRTKRIAAAIGLIGLLAGCGTSSPGTASTPLTPATTTKPSGQHPTTGSTAPPTPYATEINPPGDIPDNQVYVTVHSTSGSQRFSVQVPEGWAQSSKGGTVTYTDKLNSVAYQPAVSASRPTVASVRAHEVPQLNATTSHFQLQDVATFTRAGGSGVLVTYLADSRPDPVTNKVVRDAVQRYEFWRGGQLAILTLSGPQNADNVDPWAKVSGSFRWTH